MVYDLGPDGAPLNATRVAPSTDGALVTVAPFTTFAVVPHPCGVEGVAPLLLVDGQTLRIPSDKVRELVDARKILDPATGEVKPQPPALPPRVAVSHLGPQIADTQRYFREEAAREARLERERLEKEGRHSARGRGRPYPTGSFDPLGPIEGVDY